MSKKKLGLSLAKRGVQFAVGAELNKIGNNMKKAREEELSKQNSAPKVEKPVEYQYEYVFYKAGVDSVITVVSGLMEAILRNGIVIEEALYKETEEVLDLMNWLIDATKESNDGTQA